MQNQFTSPRTQRFILLLQIGLSLSGILLVIIGAGRLLLENIEAISFVAADLSANLLTPATFLLGIAMLLVGYHHLYAMAALGAKEPPALVALRNSLVLFVGLMWGIAVWGISVSLPYALVGILSAIAVSWGSYWVWRQTQMLELWKTFGERIVRDKEFPILLVGVGVVGVIIMGALGIILAILTERIELPVGIPEPGALLYATSFDDFNDEWELAQGRQSAEIQDGALVLRENSGLPDAGFFVPLTTRRFGDFDLSVQTHQIAGDDDNAYGVIFRQRDHQNYYRFEISGDGYYRLSRTRAGRTESITQWTPSEVVNQGNTYNRLRIMAQGERFVFFVNNTLMPLCTRGDNRQPLVNPLTGECVSNDWQDVYEDDTFKQGRIAFSVGTTRTTDLSEPVTIGFDNLVLTGPQSLENIAQSE